MSLKKKKKIEIRWKRGATTVLRTIASELQNFPFFTFLDLFGLKKPNQKGHYSAGSRPRFSKLWNSRARAVRREDGCFLDHGDPVMGTACMRHCHGNSRDLMLLLSGFSWAAHPKTLWWGWAPSARIQDSDRFANKRSTDAWRQRGEDQCWLCNRVKKEEQPATGSHVFWTFMQRAHWRVKQSFLQIALERVFAANPSWVSKWMPNLACCPQDQPRLTGFF